MDRDDRDRYAALVDTLQAGSGPAPVGARVGRMEWHPVTWTALRLAIIGLIVYVVGAFAYNIWRDGKVDTWTGPDTAVRSGQRLAGCDSANGQHDDLFPTWLQLDGRTYVLTEREGAVPREVVNGESTEGVSGYTLGELRLLYVKGPSGEARDLLMIWSPPARAGQLYQAEPSCA